MLEHQEMVYHFQISWSCFQRPSFWQEIVKARRQFERNLITYLSYFTRENPG